MIRRPPVDGIYLNGEIYHIHLSCGLARCVCTSCHLPEEILKDGAICGLCCRIACPLDRRVRWRREGWDF